MFNSINKKRIEAKKKWRQRRKSIVKLMDNAVYGKVMENLRNRIDVRLPSSKKTIKMDIKTKLYVT